MTRREWRRWAWAAAAGVAVASGAAAEDWGAKIRGPGDLPKPGDTVTMQFPGEAQKKFTVVKATRKPDGSVEVEYKDPANGKTFTAVDEPTGKAPAAKPEAKPEAAPTRAAKPEPAPAAKPAPAAGKDAGLPKAKPRAEDPMVVPPAADADPRAEDPPAKKPRLLNRIFGKKAGPAPSPAATAPTSAEPPAVAPKVAVPGRTPAAAAEPPAVMPAKPAAPVKVSTPAPLPPTPTAKPATPARVEPVLPPTPGLPVPAPLPPAKPPVSDAAPVVPVPSAPAIPVPLPPIPSVPGGGQQALKPGRPVEVVLPVGYVPADVARMEEIQPHAVALKTAIAPSVRLLAAKTLAGCRHASSDAVKGLLFDAAKGDPCPAVRADCLGYLCDLGYFTPAFAEVVTAACDDPSDEVKAAAKAARAKMARK